MGFPPWHGHATRLAMQDRIKPLQGVMNFRDFGHYLSRHGGRVRRGALYRSAHFAEATDTDRSALDQLGVALLADLRRPEERAQEPNRWPSAGVAVLTNDAGVNTPPPHLAAVNAADWSPAGVEGYMRATYGAYPFEPRYVALFGGFLRGLADGEGAAVVHCAAGKDRTGCLCALTLRLVGVADDETIADYLITNQTIDWDKRVPAMRERIAARYGAAPGDAALHKMLGVQEDFLAAYFAAIAEEFASLERYAEVVLDLDAARLNRLRARLLAESGA
ncbi:MAG: tyrosine-protein phosphatase [Caulobacterales bacterium]